MRIRKVVLQLRTGWLKTREINYDFYFQDLWTLQWWWVRGRKGNFEILMSLTSIIWFRNLSTAAGWTYQLFSKVEKHLFCQRQNLLSKSYKLLFSILLLLPCIVRKLWEENFNKIVENRKIRYLVRSVLMLVNIFGAQILLMINLTYFWLMMQLICPLQIYATLLCGYKSGTDIRSPNYIPPVVDEKVQSLAWRYFHMSN